MSISSLQSLIDKYGKNFGIAPQSTPSSASESGSASAQTSASTPITAQRGNAAGSDAKRDSVALSPEAQKYQKAHTSTTGKFEPPNLIGDFLGALDTFSDPNGNGNNDGTPNSLMDFLDPNSNDGSSNSSGNSNNPFDSLSSFLG